MKRELRATGSLLWQLNTKERREDDDDDSQWEKKDTVPPFTNAVAR